MKSLLSRCFKSLLSKLLFLFLFFCCFQLGNCTDFREVGFDETGEDFLRTNGFYIDRNQSSKDVCFFYSDSDTPKFLSTDTLLFAYHRLLNDSIKRGAYGEIIYLRSFLHNLYELVEENDNLKSKYPDEVGFILRYIGPALILLGDDVTFTDKTLEGDVFGTITLLREASNSVVPEWLIERVPDYQEIDFENAKPVAFYAEKLALRDYFRAVIWLRSVNFKHDNELMLKAYTLMAVLGHEMNKDNPEKSPLVKYYGLSRCFGVENHCSIMYDILSIQDDLKTLLTSKTLFEERAQQISKTADGDGNLYFLSSQMVADSQLFNDMCKEYQETGDPAFNVPASGLFWMAYLGSGFAQDVMKSLGQDKLLQFIRERADLTYGDFAPDSSLSGKEWRMFCDEQMKKREKVKVYLDDDSLYAHYLDTISALFDEPDVDAPEWMNQQTWKKKMNETVLSSWAQERNSLSLIIERVEILIGAALPEERKVIGFVSPYPVFYEKMDHLVQNNFDVFRGISCRPELFCYMGISDIESYLNGADDPAIDFDKICDIFYRLKKEEILDLDKEKPYLTNIESFMGVTLSYLDYSDWKKLRDDKSDSGDKRRLGVLQNLRLIQSEIADLYMFSQSFDVWSDIYKRWNALSVMVSTVKYMCQKQMRSIEWNESEANFLDHLDDVLSFICDVHKNNEEAAYIAGIGQDEETRMKFHIGTGCWRALWVLYPWKGEQILCRGAMLPYYEFYYPSWLNDSEWRKIESNVEQPNWLIDN